MKKLVKLTVCRALTGSVNYCSPRPSPPLGIRALEFFGVDWSFKVLHSGMAYERVLSRIDHSVGA